MARFKVHWIEQRGPESGNGFSEIVEAESPDEARKTVARSSRVIYKVKAIRNDNDKEQNGEL